MSIIFYELPSCRNKSLGTGQHAALLCIQVSSSSVRQAQSHGPLPSHRVCLLFSATSAVAPIFSTTLKAVYIRGTPVATFRSRFVGTLSTYLHSPAAVVHLSCALTTPPLRITAPFILALISRSRAKGLVITCIAYYLWLAALSTTTKPVLRFTSL